MSNATAYLATLHIDAQTTDARVNLLAAFALGDAVRNGFEVSKPEMRKALKKQRKAAAKAAGLHSLPEPPVSCARPSC